MLTVTQMLRKKGVVGKFVEFYGAGLASLPLADRATIANMAPEYGATCGIFPVDEETLRYLRFTGRSDAQVALVEAYCKEQGLFHTRATPEADVHRHAVARLWHGRAVPGRAEAAAGSRAPRGHEEDRSTRRVCRAEGEGKAKAREPQRSSRLKAEGGGGRAVGAAASAHQPVRLARAT